MSGQPHAHEGAPDRRIDVSQATVAAGTVTCQGCGRAVPNGSIYCPHCCGDDGRQGAIKRGAIIGGMFGLMAGGLVAALWTAVAGPERGTYGMVFAITLGGAVTGLMLGMVRQRKQ